MADTEKKWTRPLIPRNEGGLTDPDLIDWENVNYMKDIDWDNIEFLHLQETDGVYEIVRKPSVPQIGGFATIIAYQANLCRFVRNNFKDNGEAFFNQVGEKKGLLYDMAYHLARGGSIPLDVATEEK